MDIVDFYIFFVNACRACGHSDPLEPHGQWPRHGHGGATGCLPHQAMNNRSVAFRLAVLMPVSVAICTEVLVLNDPSLVVK